MKWLFYILIFVVLPGKIWSQKKRDSDGVHLLSIDSLKMVKTPTDSTGKKKHSPRKATIYSAILPGLGQGYNKKYWKIPIVYAALGITGGVFNFNLKQYRKVRFAYNTLLNEDVNNYSKVARELQPFIEANALQALSNIRSDARQNIDYSVLAFIAFWGLNVIDATVDAHLKGFDVSDDLGMQLKPSLNTAGNTPNLGISLVFTIGKTPTHRPVKTVY
jgi:hypothetical protein